MRWLILVGVIVGLGFTVPYIWANSSAAPVVLEQETDTLFPDENF